MSTFRVAVLGNQDEGDAASGWFGSQFGVQAFDLTSDQICLLMESKKLTSAIDCTQLGAQPLMTYKVYAGGRFFPTVSREELSQVMQGVEIFVVIISQDQFYFNWMGQEFIQSIIQDNLLDKCRCIVARITDDPELRKRWGRNAPKRQSAEDLMKAHGIDPKAFKDKLCVVSDFPGHKKSKKAGKKSTAKGELRGLERDIASLRLKLVGEETREAVTQPIKETVTAGKSVFNLGQRLVGWIGGMVRSH